MFLSKIRIQNFRLFQEFELVLNKGLNLIVGENNSGKTALIDAIRYTLDTTSAEWIRLDEEDFYKDETNFNIQLKFDDIQTEQAHVFVEHLTHEIDASSENRKSVLYINLEATITNQARRGNRLIKTEIKSGQNADGPRIEREIRNYLSATYLKPLRDAEAELAAGRGSRLSQILYSSPEFNNDSTNLDGLIQAIISANAAIIDNHGVEESQRKIVDLLKKLKFTNDQFKPTIDIVGSKEINEMSEVEKSQTFKSVLEKLNLSLDEGSPLQGLGYNNLLFMATELLLLRQEDDFSLLLIEEPEAHLHPQLQMKLLKFIKEEFSDDASPKLQSILTTHRRYCQMLWISHAKRRPPQVA